MLFEPNQPVKLVDLLAQNLTQDSISYYQAPEPSLIVTVGSEALARVLKTHPKTPVLSILLRKNLYYQLIQEQGGDIQSTAIFLDQPLERQLNLAHHLLLNTPFSRIAVLFGNQSIREKETLERLAKKQNIALVTMHAQNEENPIAMLDHLLKKTDILLTLPDTEIYNPKTLRGILLTAFHKHVPLIGYSKTYVKNGALASVYSSNKQIVEQTVQVIRQILQNPYQPLPEVQYPIAFLIAINRQVAGSLEIKIENEASLKETIESME